MRLRDAKPGTRLVDADGDPWTRTAEGAVVFPDDETRRGIHRTAEEMQEAETLFGPFRLACQHCGRADEPGRWSD